MSFKSANVPKGPDYDKLLQFAQKTRKQNTKLYNQYMRESKAATDYQKSVTKNVNDVLLPELAGQAELAGIQRDRYINQGIPFEDAYLDKITNWDTEARREDAAGQAQAAQAQAADAARESSLRQLESYGIDPSQTRSAALDSRIRVADAATRAAAGNDARRQVEAQGLQLGAQAVDIYNGMPAQSAAALKSANELGVASVAGAGAIPESVAASGQTASGILGNQANSYNNSYNAANQIYGNKLAGFELSKKYSTAAGLGSLVGTGIGAIGSIGFGGGSLGAVLGMAEGGPADKPMAMPRPASQGIPVDTVPRVLSKGEYIIPDDVARWEGEKSLQKMINKAREDRLQTEAQRSQNQAIPMVA